MELNPLLHTYQFDNNYSILEHVNLNDYKLRKYFPKGNSSDTVDFPAAETVLKIC